MLYLQTHANHGGFPVGTVFGGDTASNWPHTLVFRAHGQVGRHNIAGKRYDVWFNGPDGYEWHGVTYGDWTQLCHCKRTKRKAS